MAAYPDPYTGCYFESTTLVYHGLCAKPNLPLPVDARAGVHFVWNDISGSNGLHVDNVTR